jgi:hypothetical protein
MPKGFESLANVPYRWLIGSVLSFMLGMQGQLLVRSLLAWEITRSELALGYVNLAAALPMVAMSFVAGAIVDRVERKRLLMVTQTLIMANELLLLTLILLHQLTFPLLLVSTFLMGMMFPFVMPTRAAMIYGMVGRELLGNAMALQSATMNVGRFIGPAMMGMLIPWLTLTGAYAVAIFLHNHLHAAALPARPKIKKIVTGRHDLYLHLYRPEPAHQAGDPVWHSTAAVDAAGAQHAGSVCHRCVESRRERPRHADGNGGGRRHNRRADGSAPQQRQIPHALDDVLRGAVWLFSGGVQPEPVFLAGADLAAVCQYDGRHATDDEHHHRANARTQ